MDCPRCGSANASTHSFCAFCGNPLPLQASAEGSAVLFPPEPQAERSTDKAFVLMALLFLTVAIMWSAWTFFGAQVSGDSVVGVRIIAALSVLANAGEIAIMALFTRRPRYRNIILVSGVLYLVLECVLYLPLWTGNQ